MKIFLRVMATILAVISGLLVGGWFMFIGGIVDLVNVFKATDVIAIDVAIGILKVVTAAPVGWLVFYVILGGGLLFIEFMAMLGSRASKPKQIKRGPEKPKPNNKAPNLFK
jgi:hypothetical protein